LLLEAAIGPPEYGAITRYKRLSVAPVYCLSQQCLCSNFCVRPLQDLSPFSCFLNLLFLSTTIVCDRWRIGAMNVYNLSVSIWDDHLYMTSTCHHHLSMTEPEARMSLFTLNASSLLFLPTDSFRKCLFTSVYVHTTQYVPLLGSHMRVRLAPTARTTRYSLYMRKCSQRPLSSSPSWQRSMFDCPFPELRSPWSSKVMATYSIARSSHGHMEKR